MRNAKNFLFGLLALITVFSTAMSGQAAEVKKQDNSLTAKAPIIFEGDDLSFSEVTGEVFAKGNVKIIKDQTILTTDELHGNTKQSKVWVDGSANIVQPGLNLVGNGIDYNYKDRTGTMDAVKGKVDKETITAQNINLGANEVILHNGTVTRCPAQVPDYHISADKIEMWPGEKLIAYNARFWIKDKIIFTLPKYQKDLKEQSTPSSFPRIGYDSDNGMMIAQYLEVPLVGDLAVYSDLAYYSQSHFKPMSGFINRNKNYTASLNWGYEQNGDHEWVKKEPEIAFKLASRRIGSSPLTADFSVSSGKWTEGNVSGWRQDYSLYLKGDPIKLNSIFTLDYGTGFEKIKYSYNDSTNNIWRYDVNLHAKPNERLDLWTGFSYRDQSGVSVYQYDEIDVPREYKAGFVYQVDKLNGLGVKMSYDLDKDQVHDLDYTWRRNLHCLEADITYRAKRDQVTVKVNAIEW